MKKILLSLLVAGALGGGAFFFFSVSDEATIYVDAAATAEGSGSRFSPFKSPTAALAAARDRGRPMTLVFSPGTYELPDGLAFDARDTNLCLCARTPGTARLTRSIAVTPGDRVPCAAPPPPAGVCCFWMRPSVPLFFYDHQWAVPARWPNEGWFLFTQVVDSGLRSICRPGIAPDKKAEPGSFVFDSDRPSRWNFDEGVYLAGYFTHDWAFERIRAESFTASNRVMKMAGPAEYGLASGTWSTEKGRRIYAYNIRAELDAPGEYFWDRRTGRVDFIAPTNGVTEFRAAVTEGPLVTAVGAAGIVFRDLVFEYAAGDGLVFSNCVDCSVTGCTLANIGGHAVVIHGGARCAVTRTKIDACGLSGVVIDGDNRAQLIPSGHRVIDCDFTRYGLFCHTYGVGVRMAGTVGVHVCASRFSEATHTAVLYVGNDNLIESNEVWNIMRETGDAGAFYTGRDPTSYGNLLRFNYVHDIGRRDGEPNTMAFYLDDCDAGDTIASNRIVNVARGVMVGGGHHNTVIGNTFEDCTIGVSVDARGVEWTDRWDSEIDRSWQMTRKVKAMKPDEEPWCSKVPELKAYLADHPREPRHIRLEGNAFTRCQKPILLDMKDPYKPLIECVGNRIDGK